MLAISFWSSMHGPNFLGSFSGEGRPLCPVAMYSAIMARTS